MSLLHGSAVLCVLKFKVIHVDNVWCWIRPDGAEGVCWAFAEDFLVFWWFSRMKFMSVQAFRCLNLPPVSKPTTASSITPEHKTYRGPDVETEATAAEFIHTEDDKTQEWEQRAVSSTLIFLNGIWTCHSRRRLQVKIKWIMSEFHSAASVPGSRCSSCWLTQTRGYRN